MASFESHVRKSGTSYVVTIPRAYFNSLSLNLGELLQVSVSRKASKKSGFGMFKGLKAKFKHDADRY